MDEIYIYLIMHSCKGFKDRYSLDIFYNFNRNSPNSKHIQITINCSAKPDSHGHHQRPTTRQMQPLRPITHSAPKMQYGALSEYATKTQDTIESLYKNAGDLHENRGYTVLRPTHIVAV